MWARTVGMPIGINDDDKPEFLPVPMKDVKKSINSKNLLDSTAYNYLYFYYSR
jgi:hypothetical protein